MDKNLKKPVISVLLPVYNGENFLREAIDSVLNQSYHDFEFIIIDDGSCDSSNQIIKSYEDPRIRLLVNDNNLGISKSLNKGIKASQGKYIARMDCDDICIRERFEKQLSYLRENFEIDVVGCFLVIIDENSTETGEIYEFPENKELVRWITLFGPCLPHPAIMAKKEFYLKSGGYNSQYDSVEDYEIWQRNNFRSNYSNIQEPLLKYRLPSLETTQNRYNKRNDLICKIFNNGMLVLLNHQLKLSSIKVIQLQKAPKSHFEFFQVSILLNKIYGSFSNLVDLTLVETIKINEDLDGRKINILMLNNGIGISRIIITLIKFKRKVRTIIKNFYPNIKMKL